LSPSPLYQPDSPHFSGATLEREESIEEGEIQPDPFAEFTDEDFDLVQQHMDELRERQKQAKVRKTTKQRAESLFDTSAKPISLNHHLDDMFSEIESRPIDLVHDYTPDITPNYTVQPKIEAEKLALMSACVAQNNYDPEIDPPSTVLSNKFPEETSTVYLEKIGEKPEACTPDEKIYRNNQLKYNNDLFFIRRLIQTLQLRNISDPNFIEAHFPMKDDAFKIHAKFFFDDSNRSQTIIRNKIQDQITNHSILAFAQVGKNWRDRFRYLFKFDCNFNMQSVLILSYFLFQTNAPFEKRDLKLVDFDQQLFKNCKFKFMTITEIFRRVGIYFINDYCPFEHYRDKIINLVGSSSKSIRNKLGKDGKNKKIKKDVLHVIQDYYDFNLSLF